MGVREGDTADVRYWLFQANPNRYRIRDSLSREEEEWWNLNQHRNEVGVGDRVAIWVSGPDAGIYALGTVIKGPVNRPDSDRSQDYYANPDDRLRLEAKPRVCVRYDRILLDRPLLKRSIEADPNLRNLGVIRMPRRTNYPVREEDWLTLMDLLDRDRNGV
ncbi:MAG: EVE domain-containing protein [Thermomicrobiales bacterium]